MGAKNRLVQTRGVRGSAVRPYISQGNDHVTSDRGSWTRRGPSHCLPPDSVPSRQRFNRMGGVEERGSGVWIHLMDLGGDRVGPGYEIGR